MSEVGAWPLTCSVCGQGLYDVDNVMRCPEGHSFDVARQGYVNLLTDVHAERGIVGDSREMLHARRRFLNGGHFAPLLAALHEETAAALQASAPAADGLQAVLEVGCGEGFYVGNLAGAGAIRYVGFDVSKDAVRLAAGRYPGARFAVANARRQLYVRSASINVLFSIFAPRNEAEFRRVLAPDGAFIVVLPGPGHMAHVREAYDLLDMEASKEERVVDQFAGAFTLHSRREIDYSLTLSAEAVRDYIAMGPNAHHFDFDGSSVTEAVETTAAFVVLRFVHSNKS